MKFTYTIEDDMLGEIDVEITVDGLDITHDYEVDEGHIIPTVDVDFDTFEASFNGKLFHLTSAQERNIASFINTHAVEME